MRYAAIFLPAGERLDRVHEFSSKRRAEKFVKNSSCSMCKAEPDFKYNTSACEYEWLVVKRREFLKDGSFSGLMKAAGWREVDKASLLV